MTDNYKIANHDVGVLTDYTADAIQENFALIVDGLSTQEVSRWLANTIAALVTHDTKVVSIVGGPAAGKSTLTAKLTDECAARDLSSDFLSTDDNCLGTRAWRWEHERDDPLSLKDFDLLNRHIQAIKRIKAGDTVKTPVYDQESGLAIETGAENFPHSIGKVDVLFVEGDFDPVDDADMRIFIDVPAHARMQARINRDLVARGEVDPQKVAASFLSRHENQFKPHTVPAISRSDIVLKVTPNPSKWKFAIYRVRQAATER